MTKENSPPKKDHRIAGVLEVCETLLFIDLDGCFVLKEHFPHKKRHCPKQNMISPMEICIREPDISAPGE